MMITGSIPASLVTSTKALSPVQNEPEHLVDYEEKIQAIQEMNRASKQWRLEEAESKIRLLERAVKYGLATDEEKVDLEAWERYTVLLSRIDVDNPVWPDTPDL
ncbi:tail fiber assembly protein [Enterobacter quasiroggenkampii]|nr:tail fiber assembly protein [Enterobacter quasiroggenkampii]